MESGMPEPDTAATMRLPDLAAIEAAADLIRPIVPPTPQILWPLLSQRAGAEVWVKHENHTLIGAFKIRGGLIYMHELKRREPTVTGVVTATRGNHGQSVAVAARRAGLRAVIHVPHGNSTEKNAAMRAQGAELIEHGLDFRTPSRKQCGVPRARGSIQYRPSTRR